MAGILNSSIVADISGKVGNLVYSRNRGGPYVRSIGLPGFINTPKQIIAFDFMDAASSAWQDLSDFEFAEWATFTKHFSKTNNLGIQKAYTPRGFFVRCYVFRRFAGLSGNPQPIMPADLGFTKLTVSRTTDQDYNFTITGGNANSDFSVLYKTNGPYTIGTRSINTTQQVFFHAADYLPGTVNLRPEFDIGFPAQWPTVPPKRLWASCQIIHKDSGVCVGYGNSNMHWPTTPTLMDIGEKFVPSLFLSDFRLRVLPFSSSYDGVVNSITIFCSGAPSLIEGGIYSISGGIPSALLAYSLPVSAPLLPGLIKLIFVSPLSITAGITYFMTVASDLATVIGYRIGDPGPFISVAQNPTLPNPFGASAPSTVHLASYVTGIFEV